MKQTAKPFLKQESRNDRTNFFGKSEVFFLDDDLNPWIRNRPVKGGQRHALSYPNSSETLTPIAQKHSQSDGNSLKCLDSPIDLIYIRDFRSSVVLLLLSSSGVGCMLMPLRALPLNYQAKYFFDLIPCAIAVWSADGSVCASNELTLRLTGYSAQEFQKTPSSLWVSRIHPLDASVFFAARNRLKSGEDPVLCEYRFFPKGRHQEIWLSETCRTIQNDGRENTEIISVYSDVSDLVALRKIKEDANRIGRFSQVIDGISHQVTNNLQVIRGTFDYFSLRGVSSKEHLEVEARIEQTNKLMKELSECFDLPACEVIDSDPAVILEELAHGTKNDLLRHGIRLEVVQRGPLLPARIDPAGFRRALDKVFEFTRALLPNGGELKIDACVRKIGGERFLELTISSTGAACIPLEADNVFRPFLKVGGQSVGLSMMLAQEILRRHGGKIVCETTPEKPATFKILLRTRKDGLA